MKQRNHGGNKIRRIKQVLFMFMAVCMMTGAVSRAAVAANAGTATVEATLSDDGDGQTKPNEWQNSDAQNWCRTFEADTEKFSTIEQGTFLRVEKADEIWYPPFLGISQCGEGIITKQDKVFFLSRREP